MGKGGVEDNVVGEVKGGEGRCGRQCCNCDYKILVNFSIKAEMIPLSSLYNMCQCLCMYVDSY